MCPRRTTPHPPARRERRSLSHVGGPVTLEGPAAPTLGWLEHALDVDADEAASRQHVHGFHTYPARLHPGMAEGLVRHLTHPGNTVLDPFCGSGTVLVEATLAGCRGVGVDANPLAVALASTKLAGADARMRARLLEAAEEVARSADARRTSRAGATRRYPPEDVALFDPHVLLELDGLRNGIVAVRDPAVRRPLELVLSSILTKVSRKAGDTSEARLPRRLASGFVLRLFRAKTQELVGRFAEYEKRLVDAARQLGTPVVPSFEVHLGDARRLDRIKPGSVDAVITSPPYAGTYDYVAHHAARLRWLGMDPDSFERTEIGARRNLHGVSPAEARARWRAELDAALRAMARCLSPQGRIALVIADSVIQEQAVFADVVVSAIAQAAGLEVLGIASQVRPHFHRASLRAFARRPRREHVIVLWRHLPRAP